MEKTFLQWLIGGAVIVLLFMVFGIVRDTLSPDDLTPRPAPAVYASAPNDSPQGGQCTESPSRKCIKSACQGNQPSFLVFSATWCGACNILKATTLQDPAVIAKLQGFNYITIDADANPDIMDDFHVSHIPAMVGLGRGCKRQLPQMVGVRSAEEVLNYLTQTEKL